MKKLNIIQLIFFLTNYMICKMINYNDINLLLVYREV